ncbi:MAG: D-amino acid aminotransferase [Gammaproteobacteria bacterium]|nr:D-amino acid aminotransferase [Gammaproteobacteria bacterium]
MSSGIVYLNGEFLPVEKASVSVLDRGFIFGDGVYEVIPAYGGCLFRLDEHLKRLADSLSSVKINNPLSISQWRKVITELIVKNGGGDQSVYLQVTRGVAVRDHAFPVDVPATLFLMSNPLKAVSDEVYKSGIAAVTEEDIRWKYCHIKSISLLGHVMLRQQALDQGASEAILIRDGKVTEGAASNVFIVKSGELITPPKSDYLLPGITRDLVLTLAANHGISFKEADFTAQALSDADEIWLTSSTKEILPVTELDGSPVGRGSPGVLWQQMIALYQEYKQNIRDNALL